MNTTSIQTVPVADIKALAETAPQALQLNEQSVQKAIAYGQSLIDRMNAEGMTPELDQAMNDYMVKIRTTVENMKNRRTPLTQLLTRITKSFTTLENQLDKDDPASVPAAIQSARNKWAAFCAEETRKAEAEKLLRQNKASELVNLRSYAETQIRQQFGMFLTQSLNDMQTLFNGCTLERFTAVEDQIKAWSETYPHGHFEGLNPDISRQIIYNDKSVQGEIIATAKEGLYDVLYNEYLNAIQDRKQILVDMLPGKKNSLEAAKKAELERIAAEQAAAQAKSEADRIAAQQAAEKAKQQAELLAKQEAERKAEQERLQAIEEQERERKAKEEVESRQAVDMANTLFDQAAQAEVATEQPRTRTGYQITVLAPQGWLLIVNQWFNIEGSKLAADKFEKKSLGQMKTACEKHALKTGEKIDSKLIQYTETFQAVNEKG